jgi:hypothetical protein
VGIRIGDAFTPWGWGGTTHLVWPSHTLVINRTPWGRTWANRYSYTHPYTVPRYPGPRPIEQHQLRPSTARERGDRHDAPKHR